MGSANNMLSQPDFTTITQKPKEGRFWVEAPGIVTLPSGNLLATVRICDRGDLVHGWKTRILRSSDDGETWSLVCEKPWFEVSPMVAKDKLYMLVLPEMSEKVKWMGDRISIVESADEGKTWTEPVTLFEGPYWTIPMGARRAKAVHATSASMSVHGMAGRTMVSRSWQVT